MFFYINTEDDAKQLYDLFIKFQNDKKYKNLSDKELYEIVKEAYYEIYIKNNK
jgi:hypothetical protein